MEKTLRARRTRLSLFFFFFGFTFASWASRIPDIQQNLHLSETGLGFVLLAMPVGSFLTLPFSGLLTAKAGSRKVAIFASIAYTVLIAVIGFAQSAIGVAICLFLFGSSGNMLNIAINTQAIELEKLYQKVIISSFHGMWSVAGIVAAALGTYFIGQAFLVGSHFLLVAVISLLSFIFCMPWLLQDKPKQQEKRSFFNWPDKGFLILGLISLCSMICQGAMFDWSGVYFKKVVTGNPAYTGIGYTAFMVSMTAVRFITDWLTRRIGFKKIITWCGLFAATGLFIAVFLPYIVPATIGLFLVGIGVSPAVPLVFSVAGKSKKLPPPVAIAAVSSTGFIGLLIGPPAIGFIAGLTSLKVSFMLLAIFAAAISVMGFAYKAEETTGTE